MNEVTKRILNGEAIVCYGSKELRATLEKLHEDGIQWRTGKSLEKAINDKYYISYYDNENGESKQHTYPYVKLVRKLDSHPCDGKGELDILSWIGLKDLAKNTEVDSDNKNGTKNTGNKKKRPSVLAVWKYIDPVIKYVIGFILGVITVTLGSIVLKLTTSFQTEECVLLMLGAVVGLFILACVIRVIPVVIEDIKQSYYTALKDIDSKNT